MSLRPIEKLQRLPERVRMIILWTILSLAALYSAYWFIRNTGKRINEFRVQNMKTAFPPIPSFQNTIRPDKPESVPSLGDTVQQLHRVSTIQQISPTQ